MSSVFSQVLDLWGLSLLWTLRPFFPPLFLTQLLLELWRYGLLKVPLKTLHRWTSLLIYTVSYSDVYFQSSGMGIEPIKLAELQYGTVAYHSWLQTRKFAVAATLKLLSLYVTTSKDTFNRASRHRVNVLSAIQCKNSAAVPPSLNSNLAQWCHPTWTSVFGTVSP